MAGPPATNKRHDKAETNIEMDFKNFIKDLVSLKSMLFVIVEYFTKFIENAFFDGYGAERA